MSQGLPGFCVQIRKREKGAHCKQKCFNIGDKTAQQDKERDKDIDIYIVIEKEKEKEKAQGKILPTPGENPREMHTHLADHPL